MLGLVKSWIGTKFTSQFGDLIADLALDATTIVGVDLGEGLREVDIKKYIKVEKVPGGQLEDSVVIKGVMINKDVIAPGKMRRKIVNPRIILLDCPLEYKKGKNQTNAELLKEEDWGVLLKLEEEYIESLCVQILLKEEDWGVLLKEIHADGLYARLSLAWPSFKGQNAMKFWRHEYLKHGDCSNQTWYFHTALRFVVAIRRCCSIAAHPGISLQSPCKRNSTTPGKASSHMQVVRPKIFTA
ncbi:T-complex protein 1 subunit gamma [Prunus yedoensis var. nudiflora]|uniref:T-complex protein 1 subunit gamma n=1 Tax=Prunus yedoensis var. nudiflora TaxID=2094558 RepID=A0A314UEI1_PRUYE|nr:T-complex protein 1 subunit gamma [Prunus yedoensis var. nudiflora]